MYVPKLTKLAFAELAATSNDKSAESAIDFTTVANPTIDPADLMFIFFRPHGYCWPWPSDVSANRTESVKQLGVSPRAKFLGFHAKTARGNGQRSCRESQAQS
jgi:hypothetical protein